jgi:hypothetical protein
MFVVSAYEFLFPQVPLWYHVLFVSGLCAIGTMYWRRTPTSSQLMLTMVSYVALFALGARCGYVALRGSPLEKGLPWLASGAVALMFALLMSFLKGGILVRGWRRLCAVGKSPH